MVFIPRVYPEFKLTPKVNTLMLTDGIRAEHNWSIEELPEEEEVELGENQINTVKIRDKIQKIIANMIKTRYEYYGYF